MKKKMIQIPKQLQNPDFKFILLKEKSKNPLEKWKDNNYSFDNKILMSHRGNLGVLAGKGNLRVLDCDNLEFAKEIYKKLKTFAIKTCGGGYHFYIRSNYDVNHKLKEDLGEFRAVDCYVVAPDSYVIDKKKNHEGDYKIIKDIPILNINKEDMFDILKPYLRAEKTGLKRSEEAEKEVGEKLNKLLAGELPDEPIDEAKQFRSKKEGKDTSRSGKEQKELCKFILKGLSKEDIFKEMDVYAKWSSAPEQYKEKSYQKAIAWVNSKKSNPRSDWVKYLLEQEKPIFKSLGVGIHNIEGEEQFYFGNKIYNGTFGMDAIITSNKKIFINSYNPQTEQGENQISKLGINYKYSFLDSVLDYAWSNNSTPYSVNAFLFDEEKNITLQECYNDVYNNNVAYMDYSDDIIHKSVSCDILSSYFLPIFEAKGRAFFNAEKGSGKTRQSTLYDLQMFNPVMSSDMSGASYFRIIESTSASIIIDDFDNIDEEKKQSQIQVMRTGYKKGQKAVRCSDTGNKAPQSFSVFNSMVINNVGGLDDITQDRCNTYYLIKTNNKEKADKKFNDKDYSWKVQRDKKFYCALLNWKLVQETYNNLQSDGVSGRDLEKIAPILTIGKLVLKEKEYLSLLKYEKERISDSKTRDVSDDWLFLALQHIVKQILINKKKIKPVEIQLNEIVKSIITIQKDDRNYQKTKQSITAYLSKVFRNTPLFKAGKIHGGFVKYTFEPHNVLKFIEIRNYTDFFEVEQIKLLNQTTLSSLSSLSSLSTITTLSNTKQNNENKVWSGECGEGGDTPEGTLFDDFINKTPIKPKDFK